MIQIMPITAAHEFLLATPPAKWSEWYDDHYLSAQSLAIRLDSIAEMAGRAAAYFHGRDMGQDHIGALRRQNAAAAQIRKGLGFTQAKVVYSF